MSCRCEKYSDLFQLENSSGLQESVRPELGGRVSRLSEDTVEDTVCHGLVVRQTTALNGRENGSNSAGEAAANDRWTIEVKNFRGRSIGRLSSEVLPSQGERQW